MGRTAVRVPYVGRLSHPKRARGNECHKVQDRLVARNPPSAATRRTNSQDDPFMIFDGKQGTASAFPAIDSIGVKLQAHLHSSLLVAPHSTDLSNLRNLPFGWVTPGFRTLERSLYGRWVWRWPGFAPVRFLLHFPGFWLFLSSFNLQILSRQIRKNGVFFG